LIDPAAGALQHMLPTHAIFETIERSVRLSNGRFSLERKIDIDVSAFNREIPASHFLIPLIENLDRSWPFDIEPSPRAVGNLIELLRGCRFGEISSTLGIAIVPDRNRARNLGAFDTPEAVVRYIAGEVVTPLCESAKPPLIVDPACGAGYFLLEALDTLVNQFPRVDPATLARECLLGFDIDDVAIALARRNLSWHFRRELGRDAPDDLSGRILRRADALSDFKDLPIGEGRADGVIGNPPYQFFSGRGSPVALLRKTGGHEKAETLRKEIDDLARRFPATSSGCRDRYKWFINRAVEFLRPGGILGFITPNTWIAYPRYRDIRNLLSSEGEFEAVIDLGSLAFERAHVPAAVMIWRKSGSTKGLKKHFRFAHMSSELWQRATGGDATAFARCLRNAQPFSISESGDFKAAKASGGADSSEPIDSFLDAPRAPHRVTLGDIATLHEGSHIIRAIPVDAPRKSAGNATFPVLIDKTMGNLIPPELGFIVPPRVAPSSTVIESHSGPRFLIRKTGDRLLVAPSPTEAFALAHQNVYVGKIRGARKPEERVVGQAFEPAASECQMDGRLESLPHKDGARCGGDWSIPFLSLVGILASRLITDLYRAGPGGQHHRPHAQFRILFLKRLPIIVVPTEYLPAPPPSEREIRSVVDSFVAKDCDSFEPVARDLPSDREEIAVVAGRIALYHAALARLTSEVVRKRDADSMRALDDLVYHLYGGFRT